MRAQDKQGFRNGVKNKVERAKAKLSWIIFWALVGTFILIIGWFFAAAATEFLRGFHGFLFIIISGIVFSLLGAALIFLTVKEKVRGMLKKFLILTGASAVGTLPSILLHNLIYGLFIQWFGADFWDRIGLGDEPFFFFMAIVICPIAFLVGTVGTIVIAIKQPK